MKVVYFVSEDYYFCSHRLPIARAAKQAGFEVVVVTQVHSHGKAIEAEGFKLIPIRMNRSGIGIRENLDLLKQLVHIFKIENADILHNVAIKPIVFGTIASLRAMPKAKIINAFAGLGYVFTSNNAKARKIRFILKRVYRMLFRAKRVSLLFQNHDDKEYFERQKLALPNKTTVIPGSGIDISHYAPLAEPNEQAPFTVAMVSRLLKDKGIYEFIAAAHLVKTKQPEIRFLLAGAVDDKNPSSLSLQEVQSLAKSGLIEYVGHSDDVREIFKESHVVVLPSYREGLPKVLLEASACQKAIITTDVPGCRELIQNGDNGLLVTVKEAEPLGHAILRLYKDRALRQDLAKTARRKVETTFSESVICEQTMSLYRQVLNI